MIRVNCKSYVRISC